MGDKVNRTALGVYLSITESVAPFAVGKYEGPNIEVYLKSELNRKTILEKYRKQIMEFMDEDDIMENIYYTEGPESKFHKDLFDVIVPYSSTDNIIDL